MSLLDTRAPFISAHWIDREGCPLPLRALPGLRSEVLCELKLSHPELMRPQYQELLRSCTGLAGTALGHLDFTGCWHPKETCPVFNPCLTLAIDDEGRRWIAEMSEEGLPGCVWCLFAEPEVAVYVADDLSSFTSVLKERTCQGRLISWLNDLNAQAHAIWAHRRSLAIRPYQTAEADRDLAPWLAALPADAYVYDLRAPMAARGWPYGCGGPYGQLFRYGHLPVFAVATPHCEGSRISNPQVRHRPSATNVIPFPIQCSSALSVREAVNRRNEREFLSCA